MPSMWQDKDSGIYYANFRIPTDLLQHYKRSRINKSLRTKNEKEAERKNCEKWLEYQRDFDRIRRERALAGALTEESIPHLLEEWLHSTLREEERQRLLGVIPRLAEDENPGYSEVIDQLIEGARSGNHPDFLVREMAWFLDHKGVTYDSRSFAFLKLVQDFSPNTKARTYRLTSVSTGFFLQSWHGFWLRCVGICRFFGHTLRDRIRSSLRSHRVSSLMS